jgi:Zn-dependent protease with chaperone function
MPAAAEFYPPAPRDVPPDLTTPSPSYKARVVVVLVSLVVFLLLYLGLVVGSAYLCYHSFAQAGSENTKPRRSKDDSDFWRVVLGISSGVLCLFLVKGFFKRQQSDPSMRVEVTEKEQPALFAFIRQLCRDTRAPFPKRVYLTPEVNAAVFYSSPVRSLFLPTPKNLLIGLGLVNQLNLSEFKAVLAHEFGHFSQKSMKLGSYVYTSNQIIADIVYGRDWLDDAVAFLRNIDIRIAIFAWAFTGVLWGLRKVLEGVFKAINFANSSLSRQMEFNADLVAVSVSGSDALIHALARLEFANEALMQAWRDLTAAADHQLYTRDLFFHQTRAVDYLRTLQKNPRLGEPPSLPDDPQQSVQVFQADDEGNVPLMWASHPSNYDREQNAKRCYLRSPLDPRSPWVLFQDGEAVREAVTRRSYQAARPLDKPELGDPQLVQAFIDDEHAETTYHPRYHGMYDGRYIVVDNIDALLGSAADFGSNRDRLAQAYGQLYSDAVKARVESFRTRQQEFSVLAGLAQGALELKGKDFPFRDGRFRSADVPRLLQQVEKELNQDQEWLAGVDPRVFLVHYAMALQLSPESAQELEQRYRFHLAVQEIHNHLSIRQQQVQGTLAGLIGRRQLSEEEYNGVLGILQDAELTLADKLAAAQNLRLPALKNMTPGESLGRFLRNRPLVGAPTLDGKWIQQFMEQLGEVLDKTQRVHFKSLGGILSLQERIAEQWSAARAANAAAPAASSTPLAS